MKLTISSILICAGLAIVPAYAQNINAVDEAPVSGGGSLGNNGIGDAIVITDSNQAAPEPTISAVVETAAPVETQETSHNTNANSADAIVNSPEASVPVAPSASNNSPVDAGISTPDAGNAEPTAPSENTPVVDEPANSSAAENTPADDATGGSVATSNGPDEQGTDSAEIRESGESSEDSHSSKHTSDDDEADDSQESDEDSDDTADDDSDDTADTEDTETEEEDTSGGMRAYAVPGAGISALASVAILSMLF
ncbi:hypothetical protein H4R24_003248 [Coemansia sp. RSA 988]|nr:hypothetical protein H4R24_003248 [Coemansia sp. RSA 988]